MDIIRKDFIDCTGLNDEDLMQAGVLFSTDNDTLVCPACSTRFEPEQQSCPTCGLQFG